MKRLITFTSVIISAVMLTACSVPSVSDTVSDKNGLDCPFSSSVEFTLDRLDAEAQLKRFGDGEWEIEFDSPNTLSGVNLKFSEGNVEASYKGLSFSVPQSALPVKSMMLNLIEAVDTNAKNEKLAGNEKNGMIDISGSLEGGDYILTVDRNGTISAFEMPNNKLKIVFSEVTAISPIAEETTQNTEIMTVSPPPEQ